MARFVTLAACVTVVATTRSPLDESCERLCQAFLHGCSLSSCEPSGNCANLFWSDRRRVVMFDAQAAPDSVTLDAIPVRCDDSLAGTPDPSQVRKRSRRSREVEDSGDIPTSVFQAARASGPITRSRGVSLRATLEPEAEKEEDDSDNDSNRSEDDEHEDDPEGSEVDEDDPEGSEVDNDEDNGESEDTESETSYLDDTELGDILEREYEWTDYPNGRAVRDALLPVSELMLSSSLLSDLEIFPFIEDVDVDITEALLAVLQEAWTTIEPYLNTSGCTYPLRTMIMVTGTIKRWKVALSAALAVALNQPQGNHAWRSNLNFLRLHVENYVSLMRAVRMETSSILSVEVRRTLLIPQEEDEATPFPEEEESRSVSQMGREIYTIIANEDNWGIGNRESTSQRLLEFVSFVARNDGASDMADFCQESADRILKVVFTQLVLNPVFSFPSKQRADCMHIARLCRDALSTSMRQHMIPSLLYKVYTENSASLKNVNVEVSQSPQGALVFEEVMDALSTLTKEDLLSVSVNVKFRKSRMRGDGGRTAFTEKAIKEAFNPVNGIFVYSDHREVHIKPASWDDIPRGRSRDTQERYLRMAGRLLGMAIQDDQSPAVFLTRGMIALLRGPEPLPLGDAELLTAWLEQEDPEIAENMAKLRTALGYSEGSDFEDLEGNVHELTSENVDEYIAAEARRKVIDSIHSQVKFILRGVYDVLPYPQLSWLEVPELEVVLEGSRVIDKADLKRSTTVVDGTDSRDAIEASDIEEFVWFWEIYDDMTEDQVRDLLQFVSGSRNAPIQGFTGTKGDRKWLQIKLDSSIEDDMVPKAQLCFTQLRIPHYSSKAIMKKRILFAIGNCSSVDEK